MFSELLVEIGVSVILLLFGYLFGKFRERRLHGGNNLDDYDFYPFDVDDNKNLYFDFHDTKVNDKGLELMG